MKQTSQQAGLDRRLRAAVLIAVAEAVLAPLPSAADERRRPHAQASLQLQARAARRGGAQGLLHQRQERPQVAVLPPGRPGGEHHRVPLPDREPPRGGDVRRLRQLHHALLRGSRQDAARPNFNVWPVGPKVTCEWGCDGNVMTGMVVWDEQWPEAWSCRKDGSDGWCQLVFERSREVVLVTTAGRRVLGDVAIKECRNNLWGFGGWLPFGLGCTYPKHDHQYYGIVKK
ncbi:uncharacterized protein LOC112898175 [Panicum hallii]|jgi:hypothetical protein|uniref:uncharacterized protein LOC112898175 n=1 Tax=Panicum hallii TaxID=206008 RepID=UPI000DF4F170|nr:uncharacterized protein LOC112898175 [Panicum hallii]